MFLLLLVMSLFIPSFKIHSQDSLSASIERETRHHIPIVISTVTIQKRSYHPNFSTSAHLRFFFSLMFAFCSPVQFKNHIFIFKKIMKK